MLSPRAVHALDQFGAVLRETASLLAAYRQELIAGGMSQDEAFELVQQMEARILGPILGEIERRLEQ